MKQCNLLSIDLAKNVFQLCALDKHQHVLSNKRVTRKNVLKSVLDLHPSSIVMESCYSSTYWGRLFQSHGYEVRLIPPQHVKPFVKGNKNDHHDALAIAEASLRPGIHFVPIKSIEQQDIQTLHRVRQRLVRDRTALVNQVRSICSDYGILIKAGPHSIRNDLPLIIEDAENDLSLPMRRVLLSALKELVDSQERVDELEVSIQQLSKQQAGYGDLMELPGIGMMTSSALISQVGNARQFNNARGMAAWIGLTPKHQASGNKQVNQGISKRGDRYLRTLLIHCGRCVVHLYKDKDHPLKQFADRIAKRRGKQIAAVAVAHKLVRIIWAMLSRGQAYQPDYALQNQ